MSRMISRLVDRFGDRTLNGLIKRANSQNLTLREAGFRPCCAGANLASPVGNVFPQFQAAEGGYRRFGVGNNFFDQWTSGFSLAWNSTSGPLSAPPVLAAEATLDASIEDYYVEMSLGDVAGNYAQDCTSQERIRLLSRIVAVQEGRSRHYQ